MVLPVTDRDVQSPVCRNNLNLRVLLFVLVELRMICVLAVLLRLVLTAHCDAALQTAQGEGGQRRVLPARPRRSTGCQRCIASCSVVQAEHRHPGLTVQTVVVHAAEQQVASTVKQHEHNHPVPTLRYTHLQLTSTPLLRSTFHSVTLH